MSENILDQIVKNLPPPDELDELISRDPLELSAQDIDKIIAYQRKQRAQRESGPVRRTKKAETPSGIDLVGLVKGIATPKPAPKITRRF
jgi:hypothetical protein